MALWAGNFIVVKGAVDILPPVGFTFLRYVIASATVLALLRWRSGSISLPRERLPPDLHPGGRRLRVLPDPLVGRAPEHLRR